MQRMRELAPSESAFVRAKTDDQFGIEEIASRYDLRAIALWNADEIAPALEALRESRRLCEAADIPFDGQEIEDELRHERAPRSC